MLSFVYNAQFHIYSWPGNEKARRHRGEPETIGNLLPSSPLSFSFDF